MDRYTQDRLDQRETEAERINVLAFIRSEAKEAAPFKLDSTPLPAPPKNPTFAADREKQKQKPLFSGLDCLPGQQDLFDA